MGMIHVYLLVMFLSVVSVRSCTLKPGGRGCREAYDGKLTFVKGNCNLLSKKVVYLLLPATQRKLQNKWPSGIIVIRSGNKKPYCETKDDRVDWVACPENRQLLCKALNETAKGNDCTTTGGTSTTGTPTDTVNVNCLTTTLENDYITTSGTTTTETVTPTSPSTHTLNAVTSLATENDYATTSGTKTTDTFTLTSPSTHTAKVTSLTPENDYITTSGTTMTDTVTLTSPSTHRPTVNAVTSMTQENEHGQTSRTTTIETVTQTSPSTCIVDGTILTTGITDTWQVETGSRRRGFAYVTVQWEINTAMCKPKNQTLRVVQLYWDCNATRKSNETKILGKITSRRETFRGLQPDADYYITLTVTCEGIQEKYCKSQSKHTAESAPTAPPEDLTAKKPRDAFLIFKWKEPPCDRINGNITNYDFIFEKNEHQLHNVVPPGRKFVAFNGMENDDSYSFKIRANTKRGFGEYATLEKRYYRDLPVSSRSRAMGTPA